jgi:hypothetical protein
MHEGPVAAWHDVCVAVWVTDLLERVLELHVNPRVVICFFLYTVRCYYAHTLAVHCWQDVCNS